MRLLLPVAFCLVASHAAAQACGDALPASRRSVDGANYVVVYATKPGPIVVGEHFVVDFAVCPRAGGARPRSVRIDATMPEHRHGMNYRAAVAELAPGRYRAEGLLFHMPGRWEITFDVVADGATERLASTLSVE